jgi:uncharacterized protein (TIGR00251 family)
VRVTPGAGRPGVVGIHDGALRVRVGARPVEGAANRELVDLLARALGLRRADVTIAGGASGRAKRIAVAGLDAAAVRRRLASALCVDSAGGHN